MHAPHDLLVKQGMASGQLLLSTLMLILGIVLVAKLLDSPTQVMVQELHGCFEAAARPGFNLNPHAFGGSQKGSPFPCQVKVRRWLDAPPLQQSEYSDLLIGRPLAGDATQRYYDLKLAKVRILQDLMHRHLSHALYHICSIISRQAYQQHVLACLHGKFRRVLFYGAVDCTS